MMKMGVFWLYGRSGAGKTSICLSTAKKLRETGRCVIVLDGDVVRRGLCCDLGFDDLARIENHRRIAEVAKLASDQGAIVLVASMAPTVKIRRVICSVLGKVAFVYVSASEQICAKRDPKGLYSRSKGLGNPSDYLFEEPASSEEHFCIDTELNGEDASCLQAQVYVLSHLGDL